jgi:hypothetical protein
VALKNRIWRDDEDSASCVIEAMVSRWDGRDGNEDGKEEKSDFSLDTLAAAWETRLRAAVARVVPAFAEVAQ